MQQQSIVRQFLERQMDSTLADHVASRRSLGLSWRKIATEVSGRGEVRVSHETLRRWFGPAAAKP